MFDIGCVKKDKTSVMVSVTHHAVTSTRVEWNQMFEKGQTVHLQDCGQNNSEQGLYLHHLLSCNYIESQPQGLG